MWNMKNLFYFFKGLTLLILTVLKGLLIPLVYLIFPLIPFLRIYSKSTSQNEIFKNIFVDSALVSFLHAIYLVFFVEFSVRLIETLMIYPLTDEGFLNKMGGTNEINFIKFFIYFQLIVILSILVWNLVCGKAFPYLVQLGRKNKF